jgi:hypothetical protein
VTSIIEISNRNFAIGLNGYVAIEVDISVGCAIPNPKITALDG